MPLLVCPNDNAAMQSVSRSGVEFDFCPTCRGVWLDRGELEKLMEGSRAVESDARPAPPRAPEPGYRAPEPGYRTQDRHDDPRYRRDHDHDDDYRRRKKRGFDLFDIFD
ncbi:MAG: zf-TFIIB domain-containing protein [Caulobacter sp.]|nr:zf-TFIIB domain-containing protein [Caulobacter sp.]